MEAMLFAVDKINNDNDLLPDIQIGVNIQVKNYTIPLDILIPLNCPRVSQNVTGDSASKRKGTKGVKDSRIV